MTATGMYADGENANISILGNDRSEAGIFCSIQETKEEHGRKRRKAMFCSKCGNELSEKAKFCAKCGAGTGRASNRAVVSDMPGKGMSVPIRNQGAVQGAGNGAFSAPYLGTTPMKDEAAVKAKKKKTMIVSLCAAAAVLAVAVIAVVILRGNHSRVRRIYYPDSPKLKEMEDDYGDTFGYWAWWLDFDFSGAVIDYDADGRPIREFALGDGGIAVDWGRMNYEYDARGNLVRVSSGGERATILEYDAHGNLIKVLGDSDGDFAPEGDYLIFEYDASGNRIKRMEYEEDGTLRCCYEWEYDASGNEIKSIRYDYDRDGSIDYYCEYDAFQNLVKSVWYNEDGSVRGDSAYRYEYDASGNLTKVMCRGESGNYYLCDAYEYNAFGDEVKHVGYRGDGSVSDYFDAQYEYDVQGKVTRRYYERVSDCNSDYEYSEVGESYYEYEYDASGNLIREEVRRWRDGNFSGSESREYNADGNLIRKEERWNDGSELWEYNADGNVVKHMSYDADGMIQSRSYDCEYDSLGRRIKMTEYAQGGSLEEYYVYEYDNDWNITKISYYDETETNVWNRTYEYDRAGNVTKGACYGGTQNLIYECTYQYNGNGEITKITYHNGVEGLSYHGVYEYDRNGKRVNVDFRDENGGVIEDADSDTIGHLMYESMRQVLGSSW